MDKLEDVPDLTSFIPENIIIEIGKITIAFSSLEDELNGLISDLLGAGLTAGQAVTFKIRNITDRIDLAKKLVKDKIKSDDVNDALAALKETEVVNGQRNTLIHHGVRSISINADPDAHEIAFRKKDHRTRDKPKETPFKAAELKTLREDLRRIAYRLGVAAFKYRIACGRPARRP